MGLAVGVVYIASSNTTDRGKFFRNAGNVHRTYDNGAAGCKAASYPMNPD
jgi:hypothetical protein